MPMCHSPQFSILLMYKTSMLLYHFTIDFSTAKLKEGKRGRMGVGWGGVDGNVRNGMQYISTSQVPDNSFSSQLHLWVTPWVKSTNKIGGRVSFQQINYYVNDLREEQKSLGSLATSIFFVLTKYWGSSFLL